jgi:hypothetical protein
MHLSLVTVKSAVLAAVNLFVDVNPHGALENTFMFMCVVLIAVSLWHLSAFFEDHEVGDSYVKLL